MENTGIAQIEAYSPDWWKARHGSFTGSEIWKLMVEPRSKSEAISKTAETYIIGKVWETLSQLSIQGTDNFATEWGNENEPLARKWYQTFTGNKVDEAFLVYKPEIKGFTGTPDGLVGSDGMIEIKCPFNGANHLKHCFITTDDYFRKEHPEYYWQIQSYLFLTGRGWCDFISFDPRIEGKLGMFIYKLYANKEDHELILGKVTKARELYDGFLTSFKGENNL